MVKLFCAIVGEADRPFAVNIGGAESICALKKAIKAEKPDGLRNVDASNLELYLAKKGNAWLDIAEAVAVTLDGDRNPQGFDEMDPTLWIQNDKYFGKNFQPREGQIHVLVVLPELQRGASTPEQLRYKNMTAEASCLKFLDALARNLFWYDFDCEFGTYPTIGDVFHAVEKEIWEFRMNRGNPSIDVELLKYFIEHQWNELKELNRVTNRRIHDGKVFTTNRETVHHSPS